MKRWFAINSITTFATLLGVLLASAPAHAQWTETPPPANSPYWWSLSDDVSPSELRRILQDRELHRERFRSAAESGLLGESVTEEQIHQVKSYVDGRLNPELIPMYLAFESFAAGFEHWPGWREESPILLKKHGVSPEGVQELLDIVPKYTAARDSVKAEVGPDVAELMALLDPKVEELGKENVMKMLHGAEISALARVTGRDVAVIARLHRSWKREPLVEAGLPTLVQIREKLSADDWNSFRQFLLAEVASSFSGVGN